MIFELEGEPRIFFIVKDGRIPRGKQICYDYGDRRDFGPKNQDMSWLKNANESSDDEGKFIYCCSPPNNVI
jgi:hypothetical protein